MHNHQISGGRFFTVTILNVAITVLEIIGGLLSGSLALLSDAFHNLGDSLSIVMGYVAQSIAGRPENHRRTYGYRRAEILAAMLNALFLIIVSLFLIVEAIKHFQHPEHINGPVMLTVAVVGLLANLASALLLHRGSRHSLNVKATYLHVLSDALSSVAVIIGGIILTFFNVPWLDPALTIAVAVYIGYEALPIIHQTLSILMQSAPRLDYDQIKHDLLKIDGVVNVHHVHAWSIDEHRIIFSAHLNCQDMLLSQVETVYHQAEKLLKTKYGICHVTIQPECLRGQDEDLFDTPPDRQSICQ
ncbi:cation diffusion facilitator family transporter [Limosilactobacillus gorillae]|jgi:cobalt-zinc-cadmium efflux system protein|uniref:cation diffusion facilitator family transporter n=1 Tax=Limosilactobacillus gorillae TaxID=1450649 RepID=UPI000AB057CF|nr:cation diffusion facilitator family transporter [Limosilactobacillus gorillae]